MTQANVILGISDSHDAGVCLIQGGQVIVALNEERLNRHKLTIGLPILALQQIWQHVSIAPHQVDIVALAGRVPLGPSIHNDGSNAAGKYSAWQKLAETLSRVSVARVAMRSDFAVACYQTLLSSLLPRARRRLQKLQDLLLELGIRAPVEIHEHHDSHLSAAFFTSGWKDGLVLSNDGFGDGLCSKIAVFRDGKLNIVAQNSFYNSIGAYYAAVTHLCGFPLLQHTGKTTGLAAFGTPDDTQAFFQHAIRWEGAQGKYVNYGPLLRASMDSIEAQFPDIERADLAAGIQRHLEQTVATMAEWYIKKYRIRQIALTGGIHANVRANQAVAEVPGIEKLAVFPHMGDGGLALGAAFLSWAKQHPNASPPHALEHVYLGFASTEQEMRRVLEATHLPFRRPANLAQEVAQHLSQGKIVARFAGRMEYGPRALGNRSILCQATDPAINQRLNQQLKRTEFMPFAPAVRAPDASLFFHNYTQATAVPAQFMTLTYSVTDRCKSEAPAIVHVDGTARPQVLHRHLNPDYYDILDEYHKLTGLSLLINTSFNRHEEPIVCSPQEALSAFVQSQLDVLALGPFLIDTSTDQSAMDTPWLRKACP